MKTEIEARLLDINEEEFINNLKKHDATFVGDWLMSRNVYDFNPIDDGKWIRLRTNGEETTLTIKEIVGIEIEPNNHNSRYLHTKAERMGHTLHFNKDNN